MRSIMAVALLATASLSLYSAAPRAVELPEVSAPNPAVEMAWADVQKLSEQTQPNARYFWVQTPKGEERNNFLVVFCAKLNMISRNGKLKWPTFVTPDLLRIDVTDYFWDENGILSVYENLAKSDVVFHQQAIVEADEVALPVAWPGGKDGKKDYERKIYKEKFRKGEIVARPAVWLNQEKMEKLRYATYSESPILVAEWFFGQTARQTDIYNNDEPGTGYYDFLALKDRDAFFKLSNTDPKAAIEGFRTWRAAVANGKSGVSKQNRQVFRHGSTGGFVWGTLDTFAQKGKGVLLRNLKPEEFAHDAEEWFGVLPNGLPVMALFDKNGKRQAKAPPQIGSDKSPLSLKAKSNDFNIHNPLSCIRCHGASDMLRDVDDWVRRVYKQGGPLVFGDSDKKQLRQLESEYFRDINRLLKKDRADYVDAIREVTTSRLNPDGWTPEKFAEEYSKAWNRYGEAQITSAMAARELGVTQERLLKGIEAFARDRGLGDNPLATWSNDKDDTMDRMTFEETYALAMTVSLGIKPPEKKLPQKEDKGK